MKRYLCLWFVFAATASVASAQCYQFSGPGATLKINITSILLQLGPTVVDGDSQTTYNYSSDNTFTLGGVTKTSQSFLDGSASIQYQAGIGGGLDATTFELAVPNGEPNPPGTGSHSWVAMIAGNGNLIPSGTFPNPLAPISEWVLQGASNVIGTNYDYIEVQSGASRTKYPITEVATCSASASGPQIGAAVNGASFQPPIVPNSWATITGSNLSPITDTWAHAIVDGKLPTKLDGVTVSVGGKPAYVYYISKGQINFIVPDVAPGPQQVIVTNSTGTSSAFAATVSEYGPAYFLWPGNQAVATRQDFSLAAKTGTFSTTHTDAAKPGDVIILWGTGFGPTHPAAPVGLETPSDKTYSTATLPVVKINNIMAVVYGAALTPGFAGLYQVAILVPSSLEDGDWPVETTIGGVKSVSGAMLSVKR